MKSFVLIFFGSMIGAAVVLAVELPARERERAVTEARWQAGYDRLADHADVKLRTAFSGWEEDSGKWASKVDTEASCKEVWISGYKKKSAEADKLFVENVKFREYLDRYDPCGADDALEYPRLALKKRPGVVSENPEVCVGTDAIRYRCTAAPRRMPEPCPCSPACGCAGGPCCECCVK